jgi:membrane protein YqaA with SNARE-associated domain
VTEGLLGALGIYGGTLVVAFVAGWLPLVNIDVFLLGLAAWGGDVMIDGWGPRLLVVAAATAGQVSSKVIQYYLSLAALRLPTGRRREKIERFRARLERYHRRRYAVLAASSLLAFPPYFFIGPMAALLKVRARVWIAIAIVGRTVRFTIILVLPIRAMWHALWS